MFDRTMWWPVAAELTDECTLVAVDLPGHGKTPDRTSYDPWLLVDELGQLVHSLDLRRAPTVVGHSTSGLLASMFAARFSVQAVVNVGQSLDVRPLTHTLRQLGVRGGDAIRSFLVELRLDAVPSIYRSLAAPRADARLLAAYLSWLGDSRAPDVQNSFETVLRQITVPYLNVFGELPWIGYDEWVRGLIPTARCVVYDRPDQFPHLSDVSRFADDLRSLL
jgi:pimeloyl-ACP methyl ester carboxylesterase